MIIKTKRAHYKGQIGVPDGGLNGIEHTWPFCQRDG